MPFSKRIAVAFGAVALAAALTPEAVHLVRQHNAGKPKPEERVVRLYGEIDGDLADSVKEKLRHFDQTDPGKPITLVVTSRGGLVPPGLDIIDTMANLKSPVNTVCERWCGSMAAVIMAAGDHRSSQPHAVFFFHEVKLPDDEQLRLLEQDHILDILTAHSHRSREEWLAVMKKEDFITAQRAKELGALDEIQQPLKLTFSPGA